MYVEQPHDYELKYENCYCKVDGKLIKFTGFGHNQETNELEASVREVVSAGRIKESQYIALNGKHIDWRIPQLGFFNTGKQAFYSYRIVADSPYKFRRGLCEGTVRFSPVCVGPKGFSISDTYLAQVYHLFNPVFFTIEKAVELLEDGKRSSAAINNKLCLLTKLSFSEDKAIYLLYRERVVGKLEGKVALLNSELSFLYEEFLTFGLDVCLV